MLTEHPDGYRPQLWVEQMVQSMADGGHDYWTKWEQLQCPTLLVGGAESFIPQDTLAEMARRNPHTSNQQIPDAGHDLHLEQPAAWRKVAEAFCSG